MAFPQHLSLFSHDIKYIAAMHKRRYLRVVRMTPLSEAWTARLFEHLERMYGAGERDAAEWSGTLAGIDADGIKRALGRLQNVPECPTAQSFLELCKPTPSPLHGMALGLVPKANKSWAQKILDNPANKATYTLQAAREVVKGRRL